MKTHTRAVVIGGGVVGCSVLYHLARAGWTDVMLIERAELYKEIEALSGQSCGLHLTGGVMHAGTRERMDWLRMAHAKGRYLGMHTEIISAAEAKALLPLL